MENIDSPDWEALYHQVREENERLRLEQWRYVPPLPVFDWKAVRKFLEENYLALSLLALLFSMLLALVEGAGKLLKG